MGTCFERHMTNEHKTCPRLGFRHTSGVSEASAQGGGIPMSRCIMKQTLAEKKAYMAAYYLANREKLLAQVKAYQKEHRRQVQEYERRRSKKSARKVQINTYARRRRKKFPEKTRAYNMLSRAIKKGTIVRQPCEICGKPNAQAHHEDYSKPLDVRWLCFKHHREAHGQVVLDC